MPGSVGDYLTDVQSGWVDGFAALPLLALHTRAYWSRLFLTGPDTVEGHRVLGEKTDTVEGTAFSVRK